MKKDMRNMKKIVALSSLVLMLGTLSLAGCGKKNSTTDPKTEDKTTQQTAPALGGTTPASSSGQKGGLLDEKPDEKEMPVTPSIGEDVKNKSVSENEKKDDKGAAKTSGSGKKVEVKKDDKGAAGKTAGNAKKGVSAKESAEDAKKSAEKAKKSADESKKSAEESKKAAGN